MKMVQKIKLKYFNARLCIAFTHWREVWLLTETGPHQLLVEVHKGKLVYRLHGQSRRYSYDQIKAGLVKQEQTIKLNVPDWMLPVR